MDSEKESLGELLLELRSLRNRRAHGMLGGNLDHAIRETLSGRGLQADDAQIAATIRFINSAEPGVFLLPPILKPPLDSCFKAEAPSSSLILGLA